MVWSDGDSDGDGSDGGDGGDDGDCYYEAAVVVVDDDAPVDIDPMVEVAAQNMQEGRLQVQQVCGNVWENADLLAAVLELALPAAELRTVMAVSSGWRRAALRAGERWQKLGDDPRLFLGPPLRVAEFAQFPWHRAHAAARRAAASLRAHELVQLRASRDFLNASLLPGGWRHCEVKGMEYATSTTSSTATTAPPPPPPPPPTPPSTGIIQTRSLSRACLRSWGRTGPWLPLSSSSRTTRPTRTPSR